jgi:threonine aldolase
MNNHIDLRSDTVTRPDAAMRAAMVDAPVGDDVYGEDPTVNRLEAIAAEMTGHEAGLLATSGTQSNLLGILSHCQRGEEYIVGQLAHTYKYEAGGAAVLGSIQPQPIEMEDDGTLDLERVRAAIKPDDIHFARTRLLCLENTQAGKVLPLDYMTRAGELAREHNLGFHLDGARVFNAATACNVPVDTITRQFDTVSVCLSKGLGAPVGSVLLGDKDRIHEARRWRKMVGGGMRQAGMLAAAGIIALEQNSKRLNDDHARALRLAEGLSDIEELHVEPSDVQTNMVFVSFDEQHDGKLRAFLADRGVLIKSGTRVRLVTHLDVNDGDIEAVVAAFKEYFV